MSETHNRISLTVSEIAELLGATVIGDKSLSVSGADFIQRARPTDLAFVGCRKNLKRVASTVARVVIAPESVADLIEEYDDKTFILVPEPEVAFLLVTSKLVPRRTTAPVGISQRAAVPDSARIGANTNIHPFASVGEEVTIGENCEIGPGVVIGDGCVIGDNVLIDANAVLYTDVIVGSDVKIYALAVLGSEGFGYRMNNGRHERLTHLGNLVIEDDVEIGSCTTIDRAKMGSTVIGTGTRIDSAVVIGHNCQIGAHNLIISQTGLGGSTTTGKYVICAGQSGIADHVHLGDHAVVGAKTGVHRDMPGGKSYLGIPARPAAEHARETMALKRLPEIRSTVKDLKKQVASLQQQVETLLLAAGAGRSVASRKAA